MKSMMVLVATVLMLSGVAQADYYGSAPAPGSGRPSGPPAPPPGYGQPDPRPQDDMEMRLAQLDQRLDMLQAKVEELESRIEFNGRPDGRPPEGGDLGRH